MAKQWFKNLNLLCYFLGHQWIRKDLSLYLDDGIERDYKISRRCKSCDRKEILNNAGVWEHRETGPLFSTT